jgi:predicted transcriptional regulator
MVKMINNDEKLYHKFLVLLDNDLTEKLYNHAEEYDMKLSAVIRRSLRIYLQDEEKKCDPNGKK